MWMLFDPEKAPGFLFQLREGKEGGVQVGPVPGEGRGRAREGRAGMLPVPAVPCVPGQDCWELVFSSG